MVSRRDILIFAGSGVGVASTAFGITRSGITRDMSVPDLQAGSESWPKGRFDKFNRNRNPEAGIGQQNLKEIWRQELPSATSLVVSSDYLIAGGILGSAKAFDATDGSELWTRGEAPPVREKYEGAKHLSTNPVLAGELTILHGSDNIFAINTRSGDTEFSLSASKYTNHTPQSVPVNGGLLIGGERMRFCDANGEIVWKLDSGLLNVSQFPMAFSNEYIITSQVPRIVAFQKPEGPWQHPLDYNRVVPESLAKQWEIHPITPISPPIIHDDKTYIICEDHSDGNEGLVQCQSTNSGEVIWSNKPPLHEVSSHAILFDSRLIVASNSGKLMSYNPQSGEIQWERVVDSSGVTALAGGANGMVAGTKNGGFRSYTSDGEKRWKIDENLVRDIALVDRGAYLLIEQENTMEIVYYEYEK